MNKSLTILAYCSGYPYKVFKRFAGSLFDTGFSGDLYFFIQREDLLNVRRLQKKNPNWNVKYVVTEPKFHCQCFRYFSYLEFLENNDLKSDYVFISDSRDVLFQKNIEEYRYSDFELLFFEEPDRKIGECKINSSWIKCIDKFMPHENVFESLKNKNVICSGTTIGTISAMKKYLVLMCKYFMTQINVSFNNRDMNLCIKDTIKGIDQGLHNYLLYMGKLSEIDLNVLNNNDNLVNTMGDKYHFMNSENKIVNNADSVSYVAHQYDRLPVKMRQDLSVKYNFID